MSKIKITIIITFMFFNLFGQSKPISILEKKEALTKAILKEKWEEPNKVLTLIEPTIFFKENNTEIIGCSKLGGTPDLPNSIKWPKFENKPMVFYGQINLEDITKIYPESELPKNGILYFFSYFENPENEFGSEYEFMKHKSEFSVIYYENLNKDLIKNNFPKELIENYHFKSMPLKFELDFQVPPTAETSKVELTKLSKNDILKYDEYIVKTNYFEKENILGTPFPRQGDVCFDWGYSYLGITDSNQPGIKDEITKVKPFFINLLSFSMDNRFENIGSSFCYFGINKEDLKNKKFENAVFIMQ